MSSRVETPSPDRYNPVRIDRDVTPELKPSRVERNESERSGSSRSHRHVSRHDDDDEEDEEARRRRRRRERQRAEEEEEDDPEERRRRRSERREGGERREKRDRSRNSSHRSSHSSKREDTRERPDREARDRDREDRDRADRDREMKAERRDREREREEYFEKLDRDRAAERHRSSPRRRRRHSPSYDGPRGGRDRDRDGDRDADGGADALLDEIDSEARSVFVSQLAARLTSRDLGMFFEDMLGDGSVKDARIVTDRISRRSKGIGYVELTDIELVEKALALTGRVVMGLQIKVELTEAERNKQQAATSTGPGGPMTGPTSGPGSLPPLQNLPPGQVLPPGQYPPGQYPRPNINNPMFPVAQFQPGGSHTGGVPGMNPRPPMPAQLHRDRFAGAEIPYHRLYVGSLNFDLTAEDIKQVFTPFGELEFVDLHRDPATGKSKGFCFVQFLELESAKTALQTMNGFELAGRQVRVSTVNEKATKPPMGGANGGFNAGQNSGARYATGANGAGPGDMPESLEENRGQRLDHATRQSLMRKLDRQDPSDVSSPAPVITNRPPMSTQPSVFVLVSNVFNPAEETEQDWDVELAEDIKGEVESKYGPVLHIKVEKESQGEVYIHFSSLAASTAGVNGLNGRFFGGRSLVAQYISEPTYKAHA